MPSGVPCPGSYGVPGKRKIASRDTCTPRKSKPRSLRHPSVPNTARGRAVSSAAPRPRAVSTGLCASPPLPDVTSDKLLHLAEPRFPLLREEREANAASPARPAGCTGLSPRQRFTNRSGTTAATGVRKARDTPVVFTIKKFRLSHGVTAACSQRQGARTRRSTNWFPKKGSRCSSQKGTERRRVANGDPAARGPPSPAPAPAGLEGDFWAVARRGGGMLGGCTPHPTHIAASQMSISNPVLEMRYFITQPPPAKSGYKSLTCPCKKSTARGERTIFLAL